MKEAKVLLKVFQFEWSVLKVSRLRSTLLLSSSFLSSLQRGASVGPQQSCHSQALSITMLQHLQKEVRKARETIRQYKWDMHYGNMVMQNRIRMKQNNEGIQKEREGTTGTATCLTAWVCKSVQIGWNYDVSKQTIDKWQSQYSITSHTQKRWTLKTYWSSV